MRLAIQHVVTSRAPRLRLAGWPVVVLMTWAGQTFGDTSNVPPTREAVADFPAVQTSVAAATNGPISAAWQFFAGTNSVAATNTASKPPEDFQAQIRIARQHRLARQFTEASTVYGWVLQGGAPEPLQQTALLELAELAQERSDWPRAQQIYAQWLSRWPHDARVPELILYQGLMYRQMGLNNLAIAKLYAVMTSALVIKSDRFEYYQQLVLRAQNEIAETQYQLGNYADAVDSFSRLLKLDPPPANRSALQFRYIHCLTGLGRPSEATAQAQDFLARYPEAPERPEVHFLCATALKANRRETEAVQQVLALLQEQCGSTNHTSQTLAYWQRRAGNAIANQFYQEGEPLKALDIYLHLAALDTAPQWQLPVWYQVGLVFERLGQPAKAIEYYTNITAREKEVNETFSSSLKEVIEMAKWRKDFLGWQLKTERASIDFRAVTLGSVEAAKPSPPTP
jgi:tetratricopeptide (TPR) repeat protein